MYNYISIHQYYERLNIMKIANYSLGELNELIPFEVDILQAVYNNLKEKMKKAQK